MVEQRRETLMELEFRTRGFEVSRESERIFENYGGFLLN